MAAPSFESWESKVAKKKAAAKALIPREWLLPSTLAISSNVLEIPSQSGILSERELEITEAYDATQLLGKLAKGEFTSAEVTEAFSKRAAIAQQVTSCLTETMFELGKARAKFLDEYLAKEKKVFGPLHGLPLSIKDSFKVKGFQSTIGFVSFLDHEPDTENSVIVDILLRLGAVLYVKTNIPQTLMTADSHNNIFGRTLNPTNTALTAGGSSGGEGALIAFRGSPLGVGTDIAGSIRIPSLCCGTYGFKPTSGRIPLGGSTPPGLEGLPGVVPCAGPLASSFRDLSYFVSSVLNTKPWLEDSKAHAVPWRSETDIPNGRPLTIGILPEDPLYPLHPPIRRALKTAAASLTAAGHKLIPIELKDTTSVSAASALAMQMFQLDPVRTQFQHIAASGEPTIPSVISTLEAFPPPKITGLLEFAAMNVRKHAYDEEWRKIFKQEKLDAVIGPAAQFTAVPHDTYQVAPYTAIWNLLDYPAVVLPYSRVSKDLDPKPFNIKLPARGANYDPTSLDGMPCAIQVSTPRFQDEECLYVGGIINDVLQEDK